MENIQTVKRDIEEMFARIDVNGDQRISFEEFSNVLLELDHTRSAGALRADFDKIDTNQDGWVSFDEFRAWCR